MSLSVRIRPFPLTLHVGLTTDIKHIIYQLVSLSAMDIQNFDTVLLNLE